MMAMGRKIILAAALAATAGLGSVAIAQEPVSALRGLNSNAPVDISSDRIEVQERADRAIFAGNVVARQDQLTLETARLTVAYSTAGGIEGGPQVGYIGGLIKALVFGLLAAEDIARRGRSR